MPGQTPCRTARLTRARRVNRRSEVRDAGQAAFFRRVRAAGEQRAVAAGGGGLHAVHPQRVLDVDCHAGLRLQPGGAPVAGVVALVQLVPGALLAPVFAALADRHSPVVLLAGGYLVQAAALGATAVAITGGVPVAAYAGAVVTCAAISVTRPAQSTLV